MRYTERDMINTPCDTPVKSGMQGNTATLRARSMKVTHERSNGRRMELLRTEQMNVLFEGEWSGGDPQVRWESRAEFTTVHTSTFSTTWLSLEGL